MGTVETFDHTADVGFRVRAASLDDLFRTAAEALFDYVVANRHEIRIDTDETVSVSADSTAELLAEWLNELIYQSETRHRLFARFDVHVDPDGKRLVAHVGSEPIDPARHVLDHEVKAVTRHGLVLEQGSDGWTAELILDI